MILGGLVDDLIECREDVVGELKFGDGRFAHRGESDSETSDSLFRSISREISDILRYNLERR